ncbi:hypothetical protein COCCADRAFT_22545 [Bipolaris zeicola 26-R-13]|uniref:Uncharacterized protein n=1 Tax=Cochliobolus carbonum (strain 26-R-13) TaxID=930089 RepID=W6YRF9_COCC2|nr:uncharacterized protein COCCADRAFT_22545 [Bipolaris zeicola 26-R-13]EUC38004.1 hypothetical protein COCCADRAFT_22545 [Bipolaris zeicola 26-R-13]
MGLRVSSLGSVQETLLTSTCRSRWLRDHGAAQATCRLLFGQSAKSSVCKQRNYTWNKSTNKYLAKWLRSLYLSIGPRGKATDSMNDTSSEEEDVASIEIQTPTDNHPHISMRTHERGDDPPVLPSDMGRYADLPPPPPPPQSAISPQILDTIPVRKPGVSTEGIPSREFSEIERQHGELVIEREDLMGSRFQMQMDRQKISETREKTGTQEGLVMDQLRTFLHKQAITLPQDIAETFELIDAFRDQLGSLEAEYDDTEQKYTLKELKYSRKELEFIGKLKSVHSNSSPVSGTERIPADQSALQATPATGDSWEIVNPSNQITNSTTREKAPQLALQRQVNSNIQKDVGSYTADFSLLSNNERLNTWFVDILFQPNLPMNYPEEEEPISGPTHGSPLKDVPEGWSCIFAFGAQFESNNSKGTHGKSQEQDITGSSPLSLSHDFIAIRHKEMPSKRLLVDSTEFQGEQNIAQKAPYRKCPYWKDSEVYGGTDLEIYGPFISEKSRLQRNFSSSSAPTGLQILRTRQSCHSFPHKMDFQNRRDSKASSQETRKNGTRPLRPYHTIGAPSDKLPWGTIKTLIEPQISQSSNQGDEYLRREMHFSHRFLQHNGG